MIVYIIRTARIPFLQSNPEPLMALITLVVMAIGIAIPFTPIGPGLGLVPLPAAYFGWLAAILLAYACLTQLVKSWFVRRYGDRLRWLQVSARSEPIQGQPRRPETASAVAQGAALNHKPLPTGQAAPAPRSPAKPPAENGGTPRSSPPPISTRSGVST